MALEELLTTWGLPAIFAGTMVEGEGVAFMGGVLAHRGLFSYEVAALVVSAGALAADQAMFQLGRHARRFAFVRRILARPAATALTARIMRRPTLFCLGARFVYGMKTLGAIAIGAAGIAPLRYLWLDILSVLAWGHLITALGYGSGQMIENAFGRLDLHVHLILALAVAVLLLAAAAFGVREWRRRGA